MSSTHRVVKQRVVASFVVEAGLAASLDELVASCGVGAIGVPTFPESKMFVSSLAIYQ